MPDFISTPPKPKKKIPVLTLDGLIDGLIEYLPTAFDFVYHRSDIWPEREDGFAKTTIHFYDTRRVVPPIKSAIDVEIDGKYAQSVSARLYSDPFLLTLWQRPEVEPQRPPLKTDIMSDEYQAYFKALGTMSGLLVVPQPDRSMLFRLATRWDRGKPIFDE
jgi:hypothetical protein